MRDGSLSHALPHELGHNASPFHDRDNAGAGPLFPYGYGYRIPGKWSTIMAYTNCKPASCPRIPYFSNPQVSVDGTPTGVADFAEEARVLAQTMPVLASLQGCRARVTPSVVRMKVGAAATTLPFEVETDTQCTWHTATSADWLTVPGTAGARSSGRVEVSVAGNTTGAPRAGFVYVAGSAIAIEQAPCATIGTPLPLILPASGGTATVKVDALPGCAWSVAPVAAWFPGVTLTSPTSGSGPGQITFTTTANATSEPSFGYLVFKGGTAATDPVTYINFTQQSVTACGGAVQVSPAAIEIPGSGGTATFTVTAPATCTWSTTGAAGNYVTITSGSGASGSGASGSSASGSSTGTGTGGGTGNGTVRFTLAANLQAYSRGGTFAVGGRLVQVDQLGCPATPQFPESLPASGGRFLVAVTADAACPWSAIGSEAVMVASFSKEPASVTLIVAPNDGDANRTVTLSINGQPYHATQLGRGALHTSYLAEGATGGFFTTRFALLNPGSEPADTTLRFLRGDGEVRTRSVTVPARRRVTITPESVIGLEGSDFSTIVESTSPVIVDRTMTWDATAQYGSHAETSVPLSSTTWYLAEGSTSGDFALFYLLQNPNATPVQAIIKYLRPFGAPPIQQMRMLPPNSRATIQVDAQGPELASTDLSAVITASAPIIVERSMYMNRPGQAFAAGHESIGVTTPATQWFLAEGATGPFFDLFILIANPEARAATVRVDYLLLDGRTFTKSYDVPANGRYTIWVDNEDIPGVAAKPLDNVATSSTITSTNGVPIIVERTMWWPASGLDPWTEAHNSPGARETGTRWAIAEGEVGGGQEAETYILIANTSASDGRVRVTLCYEDGATTERVYTLARRSRTNVSVSADFPQAVGRRFGAIVESLAGPSGAEPAQIVVERAMYTSPGGAAWAAGTNALATRLP